MEYACGQQCQETVEVGYNAHVLSAKKKSMHVLIKPTYIIKLS